MPGELYFRVLGPVVVERDGFSVDVGGPQRRALLSVLLLHANRVVSVDQLVDALWGDSPPVSFRVQLQGLVSEVRKVLGVSGGRAAAPIETRAPGYRLFVSPDRLDLEEFRRDVLAARGRAEAGESAAAADLLRRALSLWRGPAFADVAYPAVEHAAAGLDELRLGAVEDRIDADIALGRHRELIAELRALVREHPLRERFSGQLMMVLAHSGRPADALVVYRETRERMVEELGIEPSVQLQQLHRAVLTGATNPRHADSVRPRPYVVPHQLPADIPRLVGRAELLETVTDMVRGDEPHTVPACVAVTGPAGVGKTAFVLGVAHRLRATFPDGQLYARLDGVGGDRATPGAALSHFLHSLGVPPGGVPADLDERSGLFRELLATRRVLLVLDDVADEAQLRPLLPAEPRCAVLVTSRRRLSGAETLRPVPLDVLPDDAGVKLLREIVGAARINAEPQVAPEVVRHCGGLPLAIRIAAARLASRPNWSIAHMVRRLAANRERLDWLELGDLGVRATIAETYAALDDDRKRLFRRLGLLTNSDFPAWLPAALLDDSIGAGERLLDDLVDVHLVEPAGRGVTGPRFRMHQLIHLLAGEFAGEDELSARRAALGRVLHGWFDLAATADTEIPHWYGLEPEPQPRWRLPAEVHDEVRAGHLTWFDEEVSTLADLVRQAADEGFPQESWALAQRLSTYLDMRGRYDEWATIAGHGLHAAEAAHDRAGAACMLALLVDVEANRDRIGDGMRYAERALAAFQELDDAPGQSLVRPSAKTRTGTGQLPPDLVDQEKAVAAARHKGDPLTIGLAVHTLILSRRYAGIHGGYLALFEEARDAFRACGARLSEMWALKHTGLAYLKERRLGAAAECLLCGQAIVRELGADPSVAYAAGDVALVYAAQKRFDEAEELAREALELARIHRHPWGAGKALDTIGGLRRARGDHNGALDAYMEALALWRRVNAPLRIAHTVHALAELCDDIGDADAATVYRTEYAARMDGQAAPPS